jgi:hypothetical protein
MTIFKNKENDPKTYFRKNRPKIYQNAFPKIFLDIFWPFQRYISHRQLKNHCTVVSSNVGLSPYSNVQQIPNLYPDTDLPFCVKLIF